MVGGLQPRLSRLVDNIGKHSPDKKMIFFGDFDGLVFGIGKQRKAGGHWGGGMCLKKGTFIETAKSCYWMGRSKKGSAIKGV